MIDVKILNTLLGGKIGSKIKVTTDRNIIEGVLNYIDVHGNLVLENEQKHSCFIQRSWIVSIEILEGEKP